MADVLEHLHAARADVDFVGRAAERLHQAARLIERARAGGEARHRDGENVLARSAETIHRARAYEQRVRRIDSAGDADHDALEAGRADARREALHLDVEDFGASLVARRGIRGHVREALVAPLRAASCRAAATRRKCNPPKAPHAIVLELSGLAERVLAHPLLRQPFEIDFRADHLRLILEALGLGDDVAVLGDQRVPVPREVGGRFARHRRRNTRTPRGIARTGSRPGRGGSRPCQP